MKCVSLARVAPFCAAIALFAFGQAAHAETDENDRNGGRVTALSPQDRLTYTTAFDALRKGQFEEARAAASRIQDRVLLGELEFERLFHADYTASYDELKAWLDDYADLPMAGRVYNLAMRRRPDGAAEPKRPGGLLARTWDSVAGGGDGGVTDPAKAARVALNNNDLQGALRLGAEIGDWWTAGLAAWRLDRFDQALQHFQRVAADPTEDPWVRAGAAHWASRSADKSGRKDQVQPYLEMAAQWPATFYGQIALHQLGREPEIQRQGPTSYEASRGGARLQRAAPSAPGMAVPASELQAFVREDAQARRALAFFEVGRREDAENALRAGLRTAGDTAWRMWTALADTLPRRNGAEREVATVDAGRYPMPELKPEGGFVIEQSLVLAIARKETDFNAEARSNVGAYGLMQVMPTTAAELSGDRGFVSEPRRLFDPNVNVRLGQAYVTKMLALPQFQGDVLRAVASYNAGPGPMLGALRKLGPNPDPLLLIETIDVPQAREYVEKVMASYWIYQRLQGRPLNTLDAVAQGKPVIALSLDYVPQPAAAPVQMAQAATQAGAR